MEAAIKPGRHESLFATPLFVFEIEHPQSLNALLVEECQAIRNLESGINRSNLNGWHSKPDLFARKEPGLTKLREIITNCLTSVIQRTTNQSVNALTCDGWININPKGGFNAPHNHPGFLWSGTYYVKMPSASKGRSGYIEFLDPRTNANVNASTTFRPRYSLRPEPGTLLIFPSYLLHWVYPNEEEEERITIAFNGRIAPSAADSPNASS